LTAIGIARLHDFGKTHPELRSGLERWLMITMNAMWENPMQTKETFASASFVSGKVIFNIGGNKCRLVSSINYKIGLVQIDFAMTHTEYDAEKWKE
jgi:mRNA interferase HigB